MRKKENKAANAEPSVKATVAANDKVTAKGAAAANGKAADGAGSTEMWHGADESSMIREQERQARDKKKKKHRRKKQIAAVVVVALAVGGIWYAGWGRNLLAPEAEETVSISAGFGQEIIYAQLTAVRGNEITYTVATPVDADSEEDSTAQTSNDSSGQLPEGMDGQLPGGMGGQMPGRGEGGGRPQSGDSSRGGFAGGDFAGGGFPGGGFAGGDFSGSGFAGGGFSGAGMGATASSAESGFTYDNVTYQLTDESVTTQIPVGTDVTTRLGTVTTFSRLAAGDRIALVVEEEDDRQIIMAVYIIG